MILFSEINKEKNVYFLNFTANEAGKEMDHDWREPWRQ